MENGIYWAHTICQGLTFLTYFNCKISSSFQDRNYYSHSTFLERVIKWLDQILKEIGLKNQDQGRISFLGRKGCSWETLKMGRGFGNSRRTLKWMGRAGWLAQSIEHTTLDLKVMSSSPTLSSNLIKKEKKNERGIETDFKSPSQAAKWLMWTKLGKPEDEFVRKK